MNIFYEDNRNALLTKAFALGQKGVPCNMELCKKLLKTNPNALKSKKLRLLHIVAIKNEVKMMEYLVKEHNADVEIQNTYQQTPLYYAIRSKGMEVIKFLVEKCHANIDHRDN